jgi:hypothetical protein
MGASQQADLSLIVGSGSRASPSAIGVGLSISAMPCLRPRTRGGAIFREGPVPDSTSARKRPGYRWFASGFTHSRTDSMNICATGLSDRLFKAVTPTGCRAW